MFAQQEYCGDQGGDQEEAVPQRKLEGYNRCFAGTLRLIPQSDTRLIPDLYHIVLHVLILLDILMLTACAALFTPTPSTSRYFPSL